MKLLVIRFSSIGDIVLTTPIVRCLKQQIPNAEIHFLTKAGFQPVIAGNPYIDKIHLLHDNLTRMASELAEIPFDYVIDLHKNLRSARIRKAVKAPVLTFDKLNIRKWLLVNFKWHVMPDKSIVDRYFDGLRPLGVHNDGQGLDYFIPDDVAVTQHDIPMSHWAGYVACVIGGSYETKKLPVRQWRELMERIPYPLILLGGPEDRDMGDAIAAGFGVKVYNACGKFSLNESALLVDLARVVVSNDTGLMHIAAAFKKPIVSLWGNTSPDMGMFPYFGSNNLTRVIDPRSTLVENKQLGCHPCSKLGYNKCPKGHFKCMNDLDLTIVDNAVEKYWRVTQR